MTSILIIFNAPPLGGKDTAVAYLLQIIRDSFHHTFKKALVAITQRFYEIDPLIWNIWYTTEGKEVLRPELHGKSCRGALIHVSEHVLKPSLGDDVLAQLFIKDCPLAPYILVSDGGFDVELNVTAQKFSTVHVIRLHRPNTSFVNDSRKYLYPTDTTPPNVIFHDMENNGTVADLETKLENWWGQVL